MTDHQWTRLWFVACVTTVVAVLGFHLVEQRARYWDALAPAFYLGIGGLVLGGIEFYKTEPVLARLALIVAVSAFVSLLLIPVLVE